MSTFKNKLNMFLTSMLILVLLGLIIMTLFFQSIVSKINEEKNIQKNQIDLMRQEIQYYINNYDILNSSFEGLSQDLIEYTEEFEQTYESCVVEKNQLNNSLTITRNNLKNTETQLQNKINELKNIKTKNNLILNDAKTAEEEIISLLAEINSIDKNANDLYNYINNNYDNNLTIDECLNILSKSRTDSRDIRDDASDSKENIDNLNNLIKKIKDGINGISTLLVLY
jgi:chromosome segregation ATPase